MIIRWGTICLLSLLAIAGVSSAVNPQVTLDITGGVIGTIVIELYPEQAPITVNNFLKYVADGFYNGLIFHRVIDGFMIQGGGYYPDATKKTPYLGSIKNESSNRLSHLRGTIAMARTSQADTASSEFFINSVLNDFLDYDHLIPDPGYNYHAIIGYCVFGEVVSGMGVVDQISSVSETNTKPDIDIFINTATVTLNVPVCPEKMEGDIDGDCDVDVEDLIKLSAQWLGNQCQNCYSADITDDGYVNLADYVKLAGNWLECNSATAVCN